MYAKMEDTKTYRIHEQIVVNIFNNTTYMGKLLKYMDKTGKEHKLHIEGYTFFPLSITRDKSQQ